MKTFRYVTMLVALLAMAATFTSCDKDVDPDVDAKQNYWMEFTLSNPGSLNAEAQALFSELVESVIYGGGNHYALYSSEAYARDNFKAVVKSTNASSQLVQDILLPVAKVQKVNDFEVTFTLSKEVNEETKTVLDSHVFKASGYITASDMQ